ncbi:immunity 42 family protein [Ralstonia pseudosolanacearum]|nr:immunity 42 family protein [Ralstonia pseudosolanacearum]MCK4125797.1 hypothetical protein [Ralstonia pseudosolanacearum]MCK4155339.1 hypothetical protein [Ralstonia pseudosolanacearum]OHU96895.1 hypothetical protein BLA34_22820 [Ralstonia solanacearum]QVX41700.1 immunity 42 family protein [Ralstonia solanacearum]
MIVGDPNVFAIWLDAVESWSSGRFRNGCLSYFIGGKIVLSTNSTVGTDVSLLSSMECMKVGVEDARLFELSADKAYMEIYERAFPDMDSDAEESDYKHFVSPPSLMDEGHIFFLVESGDLAKLIYGFKRDASSVIEVVMRRGEFQSVVCSVIDRWKASSL